ncbi:MAG: hypothetical protein ACETWE_02345 [Candidatus Bathyarchaeia archaeon]
MKEKLKYYELHNYTIHVTNPELNVVNEDQNMGNAEHIVMGEDFAKRISEKVQLALGQKLEGRDNVVMTRLNNEDLSRIDALVEVDVFKSRSEAAAFFIKEGIQTRKDLFEKVMPTVDKIRELKEEAKRSLGQEITEASGKTIT